MPRPVPLVALVREQRFAPAQMGGAILPLRARQLSMSETAADVRRHMRKARRALTDHSRYLSGRAVSRRLSSLGYLRYGRRIAIYAPSGGELPTDVLLESAAARGCRLYLPRITNHRARRMTFVPIRAPFRSNRHGISEPASIAGALSGRWLDLIIVPLVAFDSTGTRLGSGAGYYDRALAHLKLRKQWRRPKLVGVAYAFQQVTALERRPWDIPMNRVVTDHGVPVGA